MSKIENDYLTPVLVLSHIPQSIKGTCSCAIRARTQVDILRRGELIGKKDNLIKKLVFFLHIIQAKQSKNVTFLLELWFFYPFFRVFHIYPVFL